MVSQICTHFTLVLNRFTVITAAFARGSVKCVGPRANALVTAADA